MPATNPQLLIKCEIGFAATPASNITTVTWTDVTAYLRLADGVSTYRGRQDETQQAGAGTARFTLNNSDKRFTPDNTTGAYYPNMRLRRPVRLTYRSNAVGPVYTAFWTGYIESIDEGWHAGVQPVVRITATDLMARLTNRTMSALAIEETAYDAPAVFYPMNDSAGSTTAGDQSAVPTSTLVVTQAGTGGTAVFGTDGAMGADPTTPVLVLTHSNTTNGKYLTRSYDSIPGVSAVAAVTVECYVYLPVAVSGTIRVVELSRASATDLIAIDLVTNAPKMTVTVGASTATATSATAINDGAWHHVAVIYDGTNAKLYVDAVEKGTAAAAYGVFTGTILTVGATAAGATLFNGWLSGVAVHGSALSATRRTARAAAVLGATGDTSLQRFNRIVRLAVGSWAESASAATPSATMCPQPFAGVSAASLLYQVQDAEIAAVYIAADGTPKWRSRAERIPTLTPTSVDATLVESSTGFTTSELLLVNSATYSRPSGATVTIANADSVTAYGKVADIRTIYYNSDDQLSTAASYVTNTRGTPRLRLGALSIDLTTADATTAATTLIPLDVGDVLRVANVPRGSGSIVDIFLEGVNDTINPQSWRRTWNTAPLQIGGAVWILGSSTYGVLNSTTVLATA